ncbi:MULTISPECIES: fimbrial biogenesis chaperone [Buttiauxella]|jgi:P pilus assembly chaperone PapD|uniref:FimC family chaperone protein n=1 Tax=Buttiauxella ferragutiae ATCC 51602 TaxID=1354252 RepID=A0ABX2W9H1_9ENTR|nr:MULTISPECIES: molecular chaperone [Buttiauxella]MCE0827288.1 molecular chaperone [Buttiauxella ferragutiae]OAT28513.1 FimC family chaperone protein [Buttiauxella ferragutiae ATCC 51602]TDN47657.1 P pilus assembly chaperone PapD [Buttiauxella sp. JUb87]UNK62248.1 molecular chaperone [Buttiauxella ferragutiae]
MLVFVKYRAMAWFAMLAVIVLFPLISHAGIIVGATRVVYHAENKEAELKVEATKDAGAYLIQSWVDTGDEKVKAPFVITPPLFRIDGGEENQLRIIYSGNPLPGDRESLFWVNVRSIPETDSEITNKLQIAIKTRMKLFYRPEGLGNPPKDFAEKLTFSRSGNTLTVVNNSPWYAIFNQLTLGGKPIKNAEWVAPHSSVNLSLAGMSGNQLSWKLINDYGGASDPGSTTL